MTIWGNSDPMFNITTDTVVCRTISEAYRNDWTQIYSLQVLLCLMYSAVFVCALAGNILVLIAICGMNKLQTTRNVFIANLAVADALMVLCCMPFTAHGLMRKLWIFGAALCHFIPFLQAFSVLISAVSLCVVALDRYIFIVRPSQLKSIEGRYAAYILVSSWMAAALLCSPIAVYQRQVSGNKLELGWGINLCGEFCTERWPSARTSHVYFAVIMCVQYVLPIGFTSVCYYRISGRAVASTSNLAHTGTLSHIQLVRSLLKNRRLNRILAGIVCTYAICWFPQNLLNVLRDLDRLPSLILAQEYFFSLVAHCFSMLPTVVNPLLYVLGNGEFRTQTLRRLTRTSATSSSRTMTTGNGTSANYLQKEALQMLDDQENFMYHPTRSFSVESEQRAADSTSLKNLGLL